MGSKPSRFTSLFIPIYYFFDHMNTKRRNNVVIEKYKKVETTVDQSIGNLVTTTEELLTTMMDMYLTIDDPEEFTITMLSKYESSNLSFNEKVVKSLEEYGDEIRKSICSGVNNLYPLVRNTIADLWITYKDAREKDSELEKCLESSDHIFKLHARIQGMKCYLLTLCDDTVEFIKMALKEEEVRR